MSGYIWYRKCRSSLNRIVYGTYIGVLGSWEDDTRLGLLPLLILFNAIRRPL